MSKINKNNNIIIKETEKSGISEFIKRPLPTEEEIEEFEEIIEEEAKEEEIEEGLLEIYQDDKGSDKANIGKLDIKKKRGFIFWFFSIVVLICILGGIGYGTYYIFSGGSDATAVDFSIDGPDGVMAGEEFFYTVNYRNSSKVNIKDIRIELIYPENFVFLDSLPVAQERNFFWPFDSLAARHSGVIKIKGKIIDKKDAANIILAKITYTPENFSSEFKKEISYTTTVKDIGIDLDFGHPSSVLVGEENEIIVNLKGEKNNFLNQFNLVIDPLENLEIIEVAAGEENKNEERRSLIIEKIKPIVWRISNLEEGEQELKIKYKITKKINYEEDIVLRFEQEAESEQSLVFLEEKIKIEVMKSDLNLTLIINGSKNDQAINFRDRLNYSITYNNKGETSMKDVVIMAVLESDFLDWTTLKDENKGREKGNTLTWSKAEIGELEELKPNQEGIIDFSISLIDFREMDMGKDFQIKNYIQFSIGNTEDFKGNIDNRSNTVLNKINSDLSLKEEVRYFNEDNIPVGEGPLPPRVGEITSFKVYWVLTNNLHELQETKIEVSLPDYVSWDNKNRTSVGTVSYDNVNHKVIWQIGRLPITVYRADAEFNISITPEEKDINKIMVLLPGSIISAIDNETSGAINKKTGAKTTKLEDDEIASLNSDGQVE